MLTKAQHSAGKHQGFWAKLLGYGENRSVASKSQVEMPTSLHREVLSAHKADRLKGK